MGPTNSFASARMKALIVLLLVALPCLTLAWRVREKVQGAESCDVSDGDKQDCGVVGTTQEQCESSGCCWRPVTSSMKDTPWCYYPSGDGPGPGGDCDYFNWMRDAGLSIKAWLDVNDNNHDAVAEVLNAYVGWVQKVQQKDDPNGIDVRVEPKFTIPDGNPYTGGWCRPQTDGPALRAMALSKWGMLMVGTRWGQGEAGIWSGSPPTGGREGATCGRSS